MVEIHFKILQTKTSKFQVWGVGVVSDIYAEETIISFLFLKKKKKSVVKLLQWIADFYMIKPDKHAEQRCGTHFGSYKVSNVL